MNAYRVQLWHLRNRITMKVAGEPSVSFPGTADETLALAGHLRGLGHDVTIEGCAYRPCPKSDILRAFARQHGYPCVELAMAQA